MIKKEYKFSIWYLLIGIWVVLIVQNLIYSAMAVRVIPYSEFLAALKEKRIIEARVSENQIQGKMVLTDDPGRQIVFKTVKVDPETSNR